MSDLDDSCTLWTGPISTSGYGTVGGGYRKEYAHRAAYIEANGPIPAGMEVHHKCSFKLCVNIDHSELIPQSEHRQMRRLKCKNGHIKTPENTVVIKTSYGPDRHECRICREARQNKT